MKLYSTTKIFPPGEEAVFFGAETPPAAVVVDANGGTVVVAVDRGDGTFVDVETISTDDSFDLLIANRRIRITPSGSATFGFKY